MSNSQNRYIYVYIYIFFPYCQHWPASFWIYADYPCNSWQSRRKKFCSWSFAYSMACWLLVFKVSRNADLGGLITLTLDSAVYMDYSLFTCQASDCVLCTVQTSWNHGMVLTNQSILTITVWLQCSRLFRPSLDGEFKSVLVFEHFGILNLSFYFILQTDYCVTLTVFTSVILINILGTWRLHPAKNSSTAWSLSGSYSRPPGGLLKSCPGCAVSLFPFTLHSHCCYHWELPGCHRLQCLDSLGLLCLWGLGAVSVGISA